MNDAPPSVLAILVGRVPDRVFALAVDALPDQAFRVAAEAYDVLVRASDAVLTHVARIAPRVRHSSSS